MLKRLSLVALVATFAFGSLAMAQDVLPAEGQPDIGAITADSPAYYGQTVTVQGNVDELVNIRSFVIGGGGLGNPQLLVINNSGQEFEIWMTQNIEVVVTGVVYPHYNEGGWDQVRGLGTAGPAAPMVGDTTMDTMIEGDTTVDPMLEGATTLEQPLTEGELVATPIPGATTTDMRMGMPMTGVGLDNYPLYILSDRFPEHTILVINSVDDISLVESPVQ